MFDRGASTSVVRVRRNACTRRSSLARYRAGYIRSLHLAFATDRCNLQVSSSSFNGPHSSLSASTIIRNDEAAKTHTGGSGARGTKIIAGNASATRNTIVRRWKENMYWRNLQKRYYPDVCVS